MLLKLCTADVMYVMRYMDNVVSNPYEVWRQMSSPDYPTLQQLAQLRGQEVIHTHTHHYLNFKKPAHLLCVCLFSGCSDRRPHPCSCPGISVSESEASCSLHTAHPPVCSTHTHTWTGEHQCVFPVIIYCVLVYYCDCCVMFPVVQVNGLRFVSITKGQVLIVWKDHDVGTKSELHEF